MPIYKFFYVAIVTYMTLGDACYSPYDCIMYSIVKRYTGCIKKNGAHLLRLIISKLLKLIVQFFFEQAVNRIFTPSNVCAMTNLVKAIDLRCRIMIEISVLFIRACTVLSKLHNVNIHVDTA